jgi:hypothetical protein
MFAPAAMAAGVNSGTATPTNPSNNTAILSGGQATNWTLVLPSGAACSGDTANGGYHVFSYIVPGSVDPGSLTFSANGPSQGFPLFDTTAAPYTAKNTAVTTGQVINIPTFDYVQFDSTVLPAGDYNVGIACANSSGQGDKFWNISETFTSSNTDPNWWTAHPTTVPAGGNGLMVPVGVAGLAAVGLYLQRRRRDTKTVLTTS